MVPLELARALRDAGLSWSPTPGDAFAIPDRDLDGQVFVVSDMVITQVETPTGPVLGFNGTTEWALDSLEAGEALWLPREDQLRAVLGDDLVSLARLEDPRGAWAVTLVDGTRHVEAGPAAAYARAVLAVLGAAR